MRNQKKRGVFHAFLLFLFLYGVLVTSPAHAGVKLMGWSDLNVTSPDGTASNAGTYQYVLFGKYSNTPIVWRILSADQTGTTRKGYLYSEKALGNNKEFDTGNSNNYGTSSIRNFLVDETSGFYVSSNFTASEKSAVVVQTFTTWDGTGNNEITTNNNAMFLPSFDDLIKSAYGFSSTFSVPDVNRKAVNTSENPVLYWTRSPFALDTNNVWNVSNIGPLFNNVANYAGPAVRPACFLNLESLIFKSASDDFDLGSSPAGVAGSLENPYLLVLPDEVPTSVSGWTTTFASADKAPESATISGKIVTLEWSTAISPAVKNWPALTDFVLSTGQSPTSITDDANNPKVLKLTFVANITASNVKLSYNLNTDAIAISKTGNQAIVVNSFTNLEIQSSSVPNTPNVIPTQAHFDGSSPESLSFLLNGAALTAANAGKLSIVAVTPGGTRISLDARDYSLESRNLTILKNFLSQLGNGTHIIILYRDNVQVGKITLTVVNSTANNATQDFGSSGCNAGVGAAVLLLLVSIVALRKKN